MIARLNPHFFLTMLAAVLALGGCAGLQQFPKLSMNVEADLAKRDPAFLPLQAKIAKAKDEPEQKRLRNEEIDKRMRMIDLNFHDFETALAKEGVQANFGLSVVQTTLGVGGAFASKGASQIMSAVSGGLGAVQTAYAKATLFDQAFPALLAQMTASRDAIRVQIIQRKSDTVENYSLLEALKDVQIYYFAGSLPGAVAATSETASDRRKQAEQKLVTILEVRNKGFVKKERQKRVGKLLDKIQTLDEEAATNLATNPPVEDSEIEKIVKLRDPANKRATDAKVAKEILKFMIVMGGDRSDKNLDAWEASLKATE